ncbi:MAG: sigma-70 family RNA polymerase sigma factor [Planctomycetaceae bacterium]
MADGTLDDGPIERWQMLAELSDKSLMRRFRSGSGDAAAALYERYADRLDYLASRGLGSDIGGLVDSDDVVQSIFRTFFRRAAVGDYEVPEDMELWNLLVTISLNKIREVGRYHRRARRDIGKTVPLEESTTAGSIAGADEVACQVLQMVVEDTIAQLPMAHQKIIQLHIEGWNVPEIAAETARSKRTIERVLQEFRLRLKEQIRSDDSETTLVSHE